MGQLITPSDRKIKGPWLLEKKNLEELHECLARIETLLEEAFESSVERATELLLEDYRSSIELNIEEARLKILDKYQFKEFNKYVILYQKDGKLIRDHSLLSLLKDEKIDNFKPIRIEIKIQKGPCEFCFELYTGGFGELEIRIKATDDNIFSDIKYEINNWIDNHKPITIVQKWSSSWFPFVIIIIASLVIGSSSFLLKSKEVIYKESLVQESKELLKDGYISQEEVNKTLKIILEEESGYVPDNFSPKIQINHNIENTLLLATIGIIILSIRPESVIGIGKNKWKPYFYKKWIYIVLIYIPLSIIIPIIIRKLS